MEKQDPQPDSLASVAIKPEYEPSDVFGPEPPPAYQKPRSSAVQIARIAGVTLVLMSVILGAFILAAAWVQASASCQELQPQEEPEQQPSFQQFVDPLQSEESSEDDKQIVEPPQQRKPGVPMHFKLPLTLDFDELAGAMVERNQRSRMNCVVEKRRAEQIVDHQPRTVRLPFGLNLTSDPRYEHVTGEKMAIFCESGKDQRHMPMEIMAAPIVVPLPGPVHLPLQFNGPIQQSRKAATGHSMPLHATIQVAEASQIPMHMTEARHIPIQLAKTRQIPIHIAEARHIPFHMAQTRPIPLQMTEKRHIQVNEAHAIPVQVTEAYHIPIQIEETRHIPLQITESRHMPLQIAEAQQIPIQIAEARQIPVHVAEAHQIPIQMAEAHQIPIQMAEAHQIPIQMAEAREVRNFQEARGHGFQHMLPIHVAESNREGRTFEQVPVPMVQQMPPEQPRPHYVQPRSVRSIENVLQKRVRRCACDCAC